MHNRPPSSSPSPPPSPSSRRLGRGQTGPRHRRPTDTRPAKDPAGPFRYKIADVTSEQWKEAHEIAAKAPRWAEAVWRQINAILGYRLTDTPPTGDESQ
jgi:hypothetical protein